MTSVVVTQTTINASVVQESVSVSVTSSPINVTISPVDINSHSAVTIGTANGLSLSGQVLSLGLSSALATGALSSADWSTFNGKLSDAPSDGTTYGRLNGAWSAVVSSVAWGGITGTLSNQTDLQAALNAKQNSLTFPLASNLGGTGVNNSGTITNASNTTITGGGTVALGGFTLTVPASLTVAGLAIQNVFSALNTFQLDAGLAGVAPQHYEVAKIKRSTGGGAGVSIGYGTRGTGDPGTEEYGSIKSLASRLQIWTSGASVPEILLNGGGSIWIGAANLVNQTTAGINLTSQILVRSTVALYNETGSSSIYQAALTSGTGDLIISARSVTSSDKVIALATGNGTTTTIKVSVGNTSGFVVQNYVDILPLTVAAQTVTTNAVFVASRLQAVVSTAATGGANGFGVGQDFYAETATDGTNQIQGRIATSWVDATNASRKAKMSLSAYDTAERVGLTIDANGTVPVITTFGQTMVDGGSDVIQLRVQGHSTQSTALQTWELSTAVAPSQVNGNGSFTISPGVTFDGAGAASGVGNTMQVSYTGSNGPAAGTTTATTFTSSINISNALGNRVFEGFQSRVVTESASASSTTATLIGGSFAASNDMNNTAFLVKKLTAGSFAAMATRKGYATTMVSGEFFITAVAGVTGTTTDAININIAGNAKGGQTWTNQYGIKIENINLGTTLNYAIFTGTGLVRFGDIVNTTESYQVDGTQVVTNRVIDARIDDVINSGDATTDGVIDAIRDALITHGLIAAS